MKRAVYDSIQDLVGHTPLLKLNRYLPHPTLNLYAKLEFFNPGGSAKDRPARLMLQEALRKGAINENTTIVESSSGNLGIGLAQICASLGLKFICVTDARSTLVNRRILEAYGAQLEIITEPDPVEGSFLAARLKRVKHLLDTIPNSFNCDQYTNRLNPQSHYQTIEEVLDALDGEVDYLFCATSTCGTLRGCAEYIAQHGLSTKIIAVDAEGSVIFGGDPKPRLIPGHGAGVVPPHYRTGLEDGVVLVSDLDCIVGCRRMIKREAVFVGGSSGGVLFAVEALQNRLPAHSTCVLVLPDGGGRYLDTVYSDAWVEEHFGAVSHLWAYQPHNPEPASHLT